ncbi:LysR substrate-binding domain-containing protein [Mesorhizobium sp. M7A.F.Ca.MR.245.00.0.0]|uniref:LysR family transcriptional regulator n=1 Tax=Mesorhizobium sp. M7A.F.Ca.MR.245.00.0.0 TaxID=2496778 RepID=UPI000FCBD2FC|nr:LysR substrate-binding domain-containing protein [Mesorhizobium sp. M7A.F.Ca.MR.245.00.0.0]RUV18342.1 LysR family transcriptional regulator [Mesorhizobium sp. M7A.F.Ca.MR.245.00.0.0]RUV52142.1 LysR family transcriptional regulator [Mesorhizobium sp. M7A.F.Ca.MR.228.00.0.0]
MEGIDLRRLRYFIAVCEHGGFSRASQSIGVAQPSLTRQIKLLEKEVGISLINRSGRGAEPTAEGRFLLGQSRLHIDGLDDAVREVRQRLDKLKGEISLGICPTIVPLFLDDIRHFVEAQYQGVTLNVVEAYSGDLASLMGGGQLDAALTYRPSAPDQLDVLDLFAERLVLVTSYVRAQVDAPRQLGDISRLKLILPSEIHELRRIIDRVYRERGIALQPELELDSLSAVKAVIADKTTQYATILPHSSVTRELAEHVLSAYAIADSAMARTIAVVRPQGGSSRNVVLTALIDEVRRQAGRIKRSMDSADAALLGQG